MKEKTSKKSIRAKEPKLLPVPVPQVIREQFVNAPTKIHPKAAYYRKKGEPSSYRRVLLEMELRTKLNNAINTHS